MLSRETGSLMKNLVALLVATSTRLSSTVSAVWIQQRRYGQDCQNSMKEFPHNETLELIHFAVSSTGSRGWTMNMCSKPLTGSLTYQMNFKHRLPLTSQITRW